MIPLKPQKEQWKSRFGVVFAAMGSAIGIGNFLRFPGLVAEYGGGHFIVPYMVALLLIGFPLVWAEWTLGKHAGSKSNFHNSLGLFVTIKNFRGASLIGALSLLVPLGIFMYYVIIESWSLYYMFQYLTNGMETLKEPAQFELLFKKFTGEFENASLFATITPVVICVLVCYFINFGITLRGITKGIEKVTLISIPLLFIFAFIILIRVLTLSNINPNFPERTIFNALGHMWNPGDLSAFLNINMWIAAAGQVFFSLSIGFGILIVYASYMSKKQSVLVSSASAMSGNVFAELSLGGMITVPASFIFFGASLISSNTFGMGFVTLPNVFVHMPFGRIMGFFFFSLLFIAAVTSSISMIQPVKVFFEEAFRLSHVKANLIVAAISLFGTGFILYFSKNQVALATIDFWVGTACIYILGTFISIFFAWSFGAKRGLNLLQERSSLRLPKISVFILKYVSPSYLIILFVVWLYKGLPGSLLALKESPIALLSFFFIGVLFLFLYICCLKALQNWKKRGLI